MRSEWEELGIIVGGTSGRPTIFIFLFLNGGRLLVVGAFEVNKLGRSTTIGYHPWPQQ